MKNMTKLLYVIMAVVILIGAITFKVKGFNKEKIYCARQEIVLSDNTAIDFNKVNDIAKEVLEGKEVYLQKVGNFEDTVQIISTEITDEEKENIINKFNEEYGSELKQEDIETIKVPETKIADILKPYFWPAMASFAIVLLYLVVVYNKIGLSKVLVKGIGFPIGLELFYYSIIAITGIPFGKITSAIAIGLYAVSICLVTISFQNKKEALLNNTEKKEND